jgi:hypothetical protein
MLHKETVGCSALELLISLQHETVLKGFYLAGGTSLALQIGHRKSIDLDLFSQEAFDEQAILEFLEDKYHFQLNYTSTNTLKGSIRNINVDMLTHKYPLVSDILEIENTSLYAKEDIAAMKLNAIVSNGTRLKDFIDVYFLLNYYTLGELIDFYHVKYKLRNEIQVLKSLIHYKDVDLNDWPVLILEQKLSFNKIKKVISEHVNNYSKSELT